MMNASPQGPSSWTRFAPWILLALVLVFPLIFPSRYLMRTLVNIFFFAALGCAWNIIGGYAGQLSLGHSAFVAMGAYPTALLLLYYNVPPWIGFLPGMVVVAVIAAFLLGHLVFGLRGALPGAIHAGFRRDRPDPPSPLPGTDRRVPRGDDPLQGHQCMETAVRLRAALLLHLPGSARDLPLRDLPRSRFPDGVLSPGHQGKSGRRGKPGDQPWRATR